MQLFKTKLSCSGSCERFKTNCMRFTCNRFVSILSVQYCNYLLVPVVFRGPTLSHVQVETLSSVITNTTRADQMNRRVWESLDKALSTKQSNSKSPPAAVRACTLIWLWDTACKHCEYSALVCREVEVC